jgi:uncharacterized protein YhbP (UPF0306 family)
MTQSTLHHQVLDFLKQHPMGVLSSVTPDGSPWGSAIYYVADDEFNFYFVTRMETFKYQNLDKTPLAALTVADSDSQTTVQASGKISQLPVKEYADIVFGKLAKIRPDDNYSWSPPLAKLQKGNYMPLRLTPTKLQYANYGDKDLEHDIHAEYIKQIIPA